ncbi:MAG TPA: hypothetical protein VFD92_13395 [Candidatus Binatia bacterium]|nr:hypothetical protein [Candidatus Binatia bacterium]
MRPPSRWARRPSGEPVPAARRALLARADGTTVLETLIAAMLASLVLGAGLVLLRAHARFAREVQSSVAALSAAAWTLEVATRDVALAGADARRIGVAPLRTADAAHVDLESDLDGDGAINASSSERTSLAWSSGSGGRLLRRIGAQSMAVASPVGAGGFRLRYFDAAGVEIGGGGALDDAARARVRRVTIELAVRETPPRAGAEVRLRGAAALRARLGAP